MNGSSSSAEELLLCWCRLEPLPAPGDCRLDRKEWIRFLSFARREGVAGLVHRALGHESDPDLVPVEVREALRVTALAQAAASAREEAVLAETVDALEIRGIRPVLLRGLGLVAQLYGDGSLRPQVDHDLLVSPAEAPDAREAIVSLGFRPSAGGGCPFLRGVSVIDLHTDPYDRERVPSRGKVVRAEAAGFVERSIPARVAGRTVNVPSAIDRVLYLASHVVKHSFDRLIRLVDLAECWRAGGFDIRALIAQAREEGTTEALFYALAATRSRLDAEIPLLVLEWLDPGPRPAVDRAFWKILEGRPSPHFSERLLLAQLPGFRARAVAAREMLWPAELLTRAGLKGWWHRAALPLRLVGLAARGAAGQIFTRTQDPC